MSRILTNYGTNFGFIDADRELEFRGNFRTPRKGGPLVSFSTQSTGVVRFFTGGAKAVSLRFHVTTGAVAAEAKMTVLNLPDAPFNFFCGGVKHGLISPGANVNATAANIASALVAARGTSGVTATVSNEEVTLTTTAIGIETNRSQLIVPKNKNADGTRRFSYSGFFFGGASTESSNSTTFNVYGKTGAQEVLGYGTSLFDTSSSSGRTGKNVVYTFDSSIISPFDSMTATWAGLTSGDAISVYLTREF